MQSTPSPQPQIEVAPSPMLERAVDKLVDNAIDQISLLGLGISIFLVSFLLGRLQAFVDGATERILDKSVDHDLEVNTLLARLGAYAECDRPLIGMISNGKKFFNRWPLKTMTITHEMPAPGIARIGRQIGTVPVSLIAEDIKLLMETKKYYLRVCACDDLPESCTGHMASIGVRCMLNRLIEKKGIPCAIISLQYCDRWLTEEEADAIINDPDIRETTEHLYHVITAHTTFRSRLMTVATEVFKPISTLLPRGHRE